MAATYISCNVCAFQFQFPVDLNCSTVMNSTSVTQNPPQTYTHLIPIYTDPMMSQPRNRQFDGENHQATDNVNDI